MIKKSIFLILSLVLIFSCVGCSTENITQTTVKEDVDTTIEETQQAIKDEINKEIIENENQESNTETTNQDTNTENTQTEPNKENETQTNSKITYLQGSPYFIVENTIPVYSGEHHIDTIDKADTGIKVLDDAICVGYQEYVDYCAKFGVEQKYTNENQNYIILSDATHITQHSSIIISDIVFQDDGKIFVCQRVTASFNNASGNLKGYIAIIPVEKNIQNPTIIETMVLTKEESRIFGG